MIPPAVFRFCALLFLAAFLPLSARPVRLTLWISGGSHGVLTAGRQAPGMLGVAALVRETRDASFWIDAGGSADFASFPLELLPDGTVPDGRVLRAGGFPLMEQPRVPWTALNLDVLPQYPGAEVPFPRSRLLESPDGARVRLVGLLAGDTPLRVPPQRLRPLRVLSPEETLREHLPALRENKGEFLVVVLPENIEPGTWSRAFPDIPLLVEPAAAPPAVVPLDEGRRLRVRPAPHGRAVVRVELVWDTVARRFLAPTAEIVWVQPASVDLAVLPDALAKRLRPLQPPPDMDAFSERNANDFLSTLLKEASKVDAMLWPSRSRTPPGLPTFPESWAVSMAPVDDTWLRMEVDAATARRLLAVPVDGAAWLGGVSGSGAHTLLLPAELAAGAGGKTRHLREVLDDPETRVEILPFTTRGLLPPKGVGP